ncbi:hypothetical protein ACIPSA_06190 [Streptomyces sp. NPDC086549]|uniref:hypothetical protein n=1 Tax=Streptomyces sp. NPDC086549 TaxID=3365752 RepID=UPI0037FAF50E
MPKRCASAIFGRSVSAATATISAATATVTITVDARFAPSRPAQEAEAYVRGLFPEHEVAHLPQPGQVGDLVAVLGARPRPKPGRTDVARFAAPGVSALYYGPGEPSLAHTAGEYVPVVHLGECEDRLRNWLL